MLSPGDPAPEVFLTSLEGERQPLSQIRDGLPLLLVIYKSSCPVCQLTLPFLDRIAKGSLRVVAVSQDDERETERFREKFHLTLPIMLDRASDRYPASNAFGITHVPSLFLIEPDGTLSMAMSGFSKLDIEQLGERSGILVFADEEYVPEWKAG